MPSPPIQKPPSSQKGQQHLNYPIPSTLPSTQQMQANLLLNSLLLRHLQQLQQQVPTSASNNNFTVTNSLNATNGTVAAPMNPDFFGLGQHFTQTPAMNGPSLFGNKNMDWLQSFMTPNVVLLPVACHTLSDEQHIQLLGMPQTVIPVAVHSQALNHFPVRPLLLEPGMCPKTSLLNSPIRPIPLCKDGQPLGQFNLPVAFRHSMANGQQQQHCFGPEATNSHFGLKQEKCTFRAERSSHKNPPNSAMPEESSSATSGTVEPLDLSLQSTQNATNNISRKRTIVSEAICPKVQQPATKRAAKNDTDSTTASSQPNSTPVSAADVNMGNEQLRKRFPCDLCGDVSFLAMETLEGHKKYYCRNRPREPSSTDTQTQAITVPQNEAAAPVVSSAISAPAEVVVGHPQTAGKKQHHPTLPFVCSFCGHIAPTVRGLRTHVRISHTHPQLASTADSTMANGNANATAVGANNHKPPVADANANGGVEFAPMAIEK